MAEMGRYWMEAPCTTVRLLSFDNTSRHVDLELERAESLSLIQIVAQFRIGRPFTWSAYMLCVAEVDSADLRF